jgi:hypothetical protein
MQHITPAYGRPWRFASFGASRIRAVSFGASRIRIIRRTRQAGFGPVPLLRPSLAKDSGGQTGKVGSGSAATCLQGMSRQQVSGAVKIALGSIGVDAKHYSRISMRRGGGHSGGTSQNTACDPAPPKRPRHSDLVDGLCGPSRPQNALPDSCGNTGVGGFQPVKKCGYRNKGRPEGLQGVSRRGCMVPRKGRKGCRSQAGRGTLGEKIGEILPQTSRAGARGVYIGR